MSKKSPQLRFKGFTDDWEERKIKDIFKITRGQVLAATETSEEKSDISPFPVYSSQTKNNGLMGYYKDYLFDTAITWTTDGANAGTVSYRSGRFYSTNVNGVLISDKGYTNKAISEILNLEAWKWVSHVGNPKLMNNVMGDISIMIPSSFEEQDRLSDFLNQLDDTIALHQRKLDLLKEQKKGYLQKMFPKNGKKVPELRFAGFADDWELRKIEDILKNIKGSMKIGPFGSALKKEYYVEKGIKVYTQENIFKNDFSLGNYYITEDKYLELQSCELIPGDIVISMMGTIGACSVFPETSEKGIMNSHLLRLQTNDSSLAEYIALQIKDSPFIKQQILKLSVGSIMSGLSSTVVKKLKFPIPSIEEQRKIYLFFKQLDDTIALHQRKLDLLKEQKKGFLQKMFV